MKRAPQPLRVSILRNEDGPNDIWIRFKAPSLRVGIGAALAMVMVPIPGHRWIKAITRLANEVHGRSSRTTVVLKKMHPEAQDIPDSELLKLAHESARMAGTSLESDVNGAETQNHVDAASRTGEQRQS